MRRLLLQLKDGPFAEPILSRFASDGTLKLLAYLIVLHDPTPPPLVGIEKPEGSLHPRLLPELAEACMAASERAQLLLTTHSSFFLNALRPEAVRVLYRDEPGMTQSVRASDVQAVPDFLEEGACLGDLWLEGHFGMGAPLVRFGGPARNRTQK